MIGKYINFNGFSRNLGLGMIPTEYRDSMSYYEMLVWLCNFLEKEVIPAVDEDTKAVNELNEAFITLKAWCENYFESEDFTALVNARLDEMVEDGTFEDLLESVVDARIEEFSEEFDETVRELNEDMGELSETVGGFDDRITAVEGSVDTINNTTIPAIQGDITTITDTTIPGVQSDISDLSDTVDGFSDSITANTNDIDYINKTRNLYEGKMKPIGHRGSSTEAPENTTASFILAGKQGFWGCETDISESLDGVFYCIHDSTVDRTTDGTGSVASLTSSYIDSLTIDGGNRVSDYPGLKVPRLEEYLQICNDYGMVPVIELKDDVPDLDEFYKILYEYNMHRKAIIISFLSPKLEGILAIDKNVKTMYLQNEVTDGVILWCKEQGVMGIDLLYTAITADVVKRLHHEGLEVGAWTVDNAGVNHNFREYFVDYSTINTMDYFSTNTDMVIKTVNGMPLFNEKDLRYAEGGQFLSGILGGFIKRQRNADLTNISNCFVPQNVLARAISTMIIPIKTGSTVAYSCDSNSKFSIQAFDKTGTALNDVGWISAGSNTGTYTEARANAAFGIAVFARNDNGNINDKDLERFSKIINRVTI